MDTMSKLPKITFKKKDIECWFVYVDGKELVGTFLWLVESDLYAMAINGTGRYDTKIQAVRAYLSMQGVKFR